MKNRLEQEVLVGDQRKQRGQAKESLGLLTTRPTRRDSKIGKHYKKYSPGHNQKP